MSGAEGMQDIGNGLPDSSPDLTTNRLDYDPALYMGVSREQVIGAIPVLVVAGEAVKEPLTAEEILWRRSAEIDQLPMVVFEPVPGSSSYLKYVIKGSEFRGNEN